MLTPSSSAHPAADPSRALGERRIKSFTPRRSRVTTAQAEHLR
ncbi:tRNA (guanosine(46)-N7)-methyltransferase TrmB, partial [Streptomyces sp. DSM 41982]|nr:tRNA (guanosine(46)-N7)-methyltransferase TrmB [Streptomyces sp. DSM 41982]